MKNIVNLLVTCLCACTLGACGENASYKFLDRPENTNLELWITQKIEIEDIKDLTTINEGSCFGCNEYLGSNYTPSYPIRDGNSLYAYPVSPSNGPYVIYQTSGYPDSSDPYHVTKITITDPEVTVYGLTLNSTPEEITGTMSAEGFRGACDGENCTWKKHNCYFNFTNITQKEITIGASSTNLHHIIY